ncbi:MAG: NAD-dependent epimerase/dehydratase family protein [Betaproteobacteria bacterium]|nr:NAD-dependent epimerase/dehydratase family protein [Betaproteobacteria bacterium]
MNVLITGGAGFIGSHSVEALLAAGAHVTVLDNFSNGKRANLPGASDRMRVVEGDIRDLEAVRRAIAGTSHVLHLAAQVSVQASIADPLDSCRQNVLGFVTVLEAARTAGVQRVVFASSAAVYGMPRELPLTEDSPVAPISPYGLEKSIDEQYGRLYAGLYGLSALGLRFFNVYGPRQDPQSPYSGVISKWHGALAAGAPVRIFGDGQQTRDFVYVGDIAQVNVLALAASETGVCNVGTGTSVTLLDMLSSLERAAGRTADRRFEPPAEGDIRFSATATERLRERIGFVPAAGLDSGLGALLHWNLDRRGG